MPGARRLRQAIWGNDNGARLSGCVRTIARCAAIGACIMSTAEAVMSLVDEPGERRGLLPRFTLKDANTFLLADALGDIQGSDDGLFTDDTRMLSRYELEIAGRRPSLLGAAV